MGLLLNRAKANTATTGTGSVSLGAGVAPYRAWSSAGAVAGYWYDYLIEDGANWEMGVGLYNGTTITRPGPGVDPWFDSSSASLISLSGSATVACVANKDTLAAGSLYMPPLASTFTSWINQGSATLTNTKRNGLVLQAPKASGQNQHVALVATPVTPYSLVARIGAQFLSTNQDGGIVVSDGTKLRSLALQNNLLVIWSWNAFNSFSATVASWNVTTSGGGRDIWLQIKDDGTNRTFWWGHDLDTIQQVFSEVNTTFLTASKAGFMAEDQGNLSAVNLALRYWSLG